MKANSVNFHFTRKCNYNCTYCFHTFSTAHMLSLDEMKVGLKKLSLYGIKKINFSGGEPFLFANNILGPLIKYCKEDLNFESISIISNGSLIELNWLNKYHYYIDILGISIDSFNKNTIIELNRGNGEILEKIKQIRNWCSEHNILFKINTVINKLNYTEDMSQEIINLNPFRWKCFKILYIQGENININSLRLDISEIEFDYFINNHKSIKSIIPENNDIMRNSYLILNENFEFLNCENLDKKPSESILITSVENAILQAGFDKEKFTLRNGKYNWKK